MEEVTFNQLMGTLREYVYRATDPRLSGWEHNTIESGYTRLETY